MLLCRARRGRKVLEERIIRDEDKIQGLEKELEVTILFGEEADRKYEEVGCMYTSAEDHMPLKILRLHWEINIVEVKQASKKYYISNVHAELRCSKMNNE